MKALSALAYVLAATWLLLKLTDYIYKVTNDKTYVYVTLGVFALIGATLPPAFLCLVYRLYYRR